MIVSFRASRALVFHRYPQIPADNPGDSRHNPWGRGCVRAMVRGGNIDRRPLNITDAILGLWKIGDGARVSLWPLTSTSPRSSTIHRPNY